MTQYRQHRTGFNAGSNLITGNNNIDIGSAGVAGESNRIRIGAKGAQKAAFIAGVSGVIVANGVGVIVNPQGQLGTVVSSERFKSASPFVTPKGTTELFTLQSV